MRKIPKAESGYSKLTPALRADIMRMYRNGVHVVDIEKTLNASAHTVRLVIRDSEERRHRDWTEQDIDRVANMVKQGLSTKQIAREMGATPTQIGCMRYYYNLTKKLLCK